MLLISLLFGLVRFQTSKHIKIRFQFFQNDYDLKIQIIHITNYNRTYWSSPWASMNWYNRSQRVMNVNFTLIKDSGRNVKVNLLKFNSLNVVCTAIYIILSVGYTGL